MPAAAELLAQERADVETALAAGDDHRLVFEPQHHEDGVHLVEVHQGVGQGRERRHVALVLGAGEGDAHAPALEHLKVLHEHAQHRPRGGVGVAAHPVAHRGELGAVLEQPSPHAQVGRGGTGVGEAAGVFPQPRVGEGGVLGRGLEPALHHAQAHHGYGRAVRSHRAPGRRQVALAARVVVVDHEGHPAHQLRQRADAAGLGGVADDYLLYALELQLVLVEEGQVVGEELHHLPHPPLEPAHAHQAGARMEVARQHHRPQRVEVEVLVPDDDLHVPLSLRPRPQARA